MDKFLRHTILAIATSLLIIGCSLSGNSDNVSPNIDTSLVTAQPGDTVTDNSNPTQGIRSFPTPTVIETFIAEQEYEFGWAFFLEARAEIWIASFRDSNSGSWTIYEDTFFLESQRTGNEPVVQIPIDPPQDKLAPTRGFGWVWANNLEVREALGWGIMPERGQPTTLRYEAGGFINNDGVYVARPGRYFLATVDNRVFTFDEDSLAFTIE